MCTCWRDAGKDRWRKGKVGIPIRRIQRMPLVVCSVAASGAAIAVVGTDEA